MFQPFLEAQIPFAFQRPAGCHDTDVPGAAERCSGLERRFDSHEGDVVVQVPQGIDGQRGGRVAGHNHGIQRKLLSKLGDNSLRAINNRLRGAFTVRRKCFVCHIDEVRLRQFGQEGPKHTQATDTTVENSYCVGEMAQALATAMPLNSPDAMRFSHSAGPVMCALVPPASTATVTGMSTTSNS